MRIRLYVVEGDETKLRYDMECINVRIEDDENIRVNTSPTTFRLISSKSYDIMILDRTV